MGKIKNWLNSNNDYKTGVSLYKESGMADVSYFPFLEKVLENPTSEAKSLLLSELTRIGQIEVDEPKEKAIKSSDKSPKVISVRTAKPYVAVIRGEIKPEDMPSNIRAIYDKNGAIFLQMKELREKSKDKTTPKDEASAILEYLYKLEDTYNSNWDEIDEWYLKTLENDPDRDKKELAFKVFKLTIQKGNFENYIRRYKNDENKVSDFKGKLIEVVKTLEELTGEKLK